MISRLRELVAERAAPFRVGSNELLARDLVSGLGKPGHISANGTCRIIKARDRWIALNLAREDDLDVIPALTGIDHGAWEAVVSTASAQEAITFRDRAVELQLPVAIVGECVAGPLTSYNVSASPKKVVDMSALWAGPLCAALLARMGAEVWRINSVGRPDTIAYGSPRLDAWLNGEKTQIHMDLREERARTELFAMLEEADILVTSARPAALARLGLEPCRFPNLTWVAITSHGFSGSGAVRVGFGDDCAAAGGLVEWKGEVPKLFGDALADPLTGLEAALAVLSGRSGLLDMAMSRVAASYAEAIV